MCGVFGAIKNFSKDKIRVLGILNQTRGSHGSGLFDLDYTLKQAEDFQTFCNNGGYDFIEKANKFIVGHTRFATEGSKTNNNCHPFVCEDITGIHNGQIRNFKELKKKYKQKQFKVDSQIIFYLLNKKGIEGLKELVGYYTIIWHDSKEPNKIKVLQHECDFAYTRFEGSLYFSSDSEDLLTAVGQNAKIIESEENTLYEFDIDTLRIRKEKIKGLKVDTGSNLTKVSGGYANSYSPSEYDESDWKNDNWYHNDKTDSNLDRALKSQKITTTYIEDDTLAITDRSVWFNCPTCDEYLELEEFQKGHCGSCGEQLSGVVYECLDCENYMMLEDIVKTETDNCIHCHGELNELQYK